MRKKVVFWVVLIFGSYLIMILSRDLYSIIGSKKRLDEAESEMVRLEEERMRLKEELKLVQGDEFVEKEARDKLLLGREGEVVVLLRQQEEITNYKLQITNDQEEDLKNWEKWLKVFGF